MTLQERKLDLTDWKLLEILQEDGRISYRELGQKIGLSTPAVSERVRKLEEVGVIVGYGARLDLAKLDRVITAFVSVNTRPERNDPLQDFVKKTPEVLEAHYITGQASFILKISLTSIAALEDFIKRLSHFGPTQTSIVLSTHVESRVIREKGHYAS
ncbi:MAG: Lrp/AsnC family leucine-responsive transcriptional regulator [Cellvibrionaceae bacterium]